MDIRGKVVLITGASRGIGAACADSFGKRGAKLALGSRTKIDRDGAITLTGDLRQPEDRLALVERTIVHYGRIDILVNNAGVGLYGPTAEMDLPQAQELFALNFFACVGMAQLVLPYMRSQGAGAIVNVSSIAAEIALPWMTLYSASKAALSSFSSGLRRELHGTAIQVTDVLPGYVTTAFQGSAMGQPPPGVLRARQHAITPQECAESIARGVERGARRVSTPTSGWLAILLERLLPSVIDSPLSNMNR